LRDGKLAIVGEERRAAELHDRRTRSRSGRRRTDQEKPWYMRRRLWLAAASLMFVGWRRITARKSTA